MKAISIRQPWAFAIVHAGKRIENRAQITKHRGPILIHAARTSQVLRAAGYTSIDDEYRSAVAAILALKTIADIGLGFAVPALADLPRGGIVARARLVDVIDRTGSFYIDGGKTRDVVDERWHIPGCYGYVLEDVEPVPFVPCRGALGVFDLADELVPARDGAAR